MESAPRSVYSIGAVASMLGVPPATLRTWEDRYAIVAPGRSVSGQRLYSREQVEQVRFVVGEIRRGLSAADAHRELAQRLQGTGDAHDAPAAGGSKLLILVAERDAYSAALLEFQLRGQGFQVQTALGVEQTKNSFEQLHPSLTVVELMIDGVSGERLCGWLKANGTPPVLAVSSLDAGERALNAGADAFLAKPIRHTHLIAAVNALLGLGAMLGPGARVAA